MIDEDIKKFVFSQMNEAKIQTFLERQKNFDPRHCKRANQSNLLHHLCYEGKKQLIQLYLNHLYNLSWEQEQDHPSAKKKVSLWINEKNQDGFTCILYACFNGHVEIVDLLIGKGGNFLLKNNAGLGALHVAAQNNKVSTLIYFRQKLNYNQPDNNGITPLHWASCNGSEDAVAYLLTVQNLLMDLQDNEGQTALLLATAYGNTKIVRRLLMKGANRNIRNQQGKLPVEIAKESQFTNIRKMLDQNYSTCDFLKFYYNVKVQYKPQQRSMQIPIVFIVTALCALLILNSLLVFSEYYLYLIQGCAIGMMFVLYWSLLYPPTKLAKQTITPHNTQRICFECCRKRPKRGYHCDICKKCIQQYDHHCTWINNCVGKHNIARFIIFIFFLLISLAIIGSTAVWALLRTIQVIDTEVWWIRLRLEDSETQSSWRKWAQVGLLSLNIIVSLFFIPVFLLFVVQIKNVLNNRTTYETVRGNVSDINSTRSKRSVLQNCQLMCIKNRESFISQQSADDQLLSH